MLSSLIAHAGQPPTPHDLWGAWNPDPVLLLVLTLPCWAYVRGRLGTARARFDGRRAGCFVAAVLTLAVALLSPLEALSSALASAHMVQHVLIVLVAGPLFAIAAPGSAILRGAPAPLRTTVGTWRRLMRGRLPTTGLLRNPVAMWALHVATLWLWHSSYAYDAALASDPIHIVEHISFLVTGVLFWRLVVGTRSPGRVANGFGILLVFAMAMQSVFLSVLLTFSNEPWYDGYASTTDPWGLGQLADQQLAGVIMWVPAGVVYVVTALGLFGAWMRASDRGSVELGGT